MPLSRRTAAVVAGALLLASPQLVAELGSPCNTAVTVLPEYVKVTAIARCTFVTFGVQDNSARVTGDHRLSPGDKHAVCSDPGYCGTTLEVTPYTANTTYTSRATFTATGRRDQHGNYFRYVARAHHQNGRHEAYYDVFFRVAR